MCGRRKEKEGSIALQVTEAAVSVLREVIERPEVPETAIRIQPI